MRTKRNGIRHTAGILSAGVLMAFALTAFHGAAAGAEGCCEQENTKVSADTTAAVSTKTKAKKSGDDEVVIGLVSGSLCAAPLHIAIDNGYLEEEFSEAGIAWRVEEINLNDLGDLVASNKVDASTQLAGAAIPQIDSGLEIQFTAGLHTGCTKYYVTEDSSITSVADLKGKKIGVPGLGDSSVIALKRKLFDEGIGATTQNMEVEFIVYNMTDLPIALANGAVDAIALHDPVAYSAEEEYGFRKILDLSTDEKFKQEYCCMAFVTTRLAEENPEAAAAYTRAMLKAAAFVQANPEEAARLQIENGQTSGDEETNAKILSSYNYNPSVSAAYQTIYDAANELIRIGDITSVGDVDAFTERAFVELDGVPDSYIYQEDGTFKEVS